MARELVDEDLRGVRFDRCDLRGAVLRGCDVTDLEIDSPWLGEAGSTLVVNGVDVTGFVDAELDRRFPGRSLREAESPEGLREAWAAVQRTWAATLARVETMPGDAVDASVDGEWSFVQTLRHLVMATDVWLRQTVLGVEQPFHPIGQPFAEYETDGYDVSVFSEPDPPYATVLEVRDERVAMVSDVLARATPELLSERRPHPWAPTRTTSVLACLHTILREEWEHHRYAVRDLDVLARS